MFTHRLLGLGLLLSSSFAFGTIVDPIEGVVPSHTIGEHSGGVWHEREEDLEPVEHEEIFQQVSEWKNLQDFELDNELRVCIENSCQDYDLHNDGKHREIFKIYLPKKAKKSKNGKGAEAVATLLNGISKGVSAGGRLRIKNIKVNVDGSFQIDGLDIQFGVAAGTDAPIPGMEDGKQTHHK